MRFRSRSSIGSATEIAERNSTKLDRKQDLNIPNQTKCVIVRSIRKPRWPPYPIRQQSGILNSGARYVALWAPCYTPPQTKSGGYIGLYPPQTKFGGYIGITLSVCLSVRPSVRPSVQSKLNLNHNFLTKGDRALTLHKCIPCDKSFLSIPNFFSSWPWSWLLTYFWKNLTLAITLNLTRWGFHISHVYFLWQDIFVGTNFFYLVTLTLTFDLLLKKHNLHHNFWTKSERALILHISIPCDKTFLLIPILLI